MATIKVAQVNDRTQVREVSDTSWKHWPKSKDVPGGRVAGRETYVIAEAVEAAPAARVVVPPEVEQIASGGNDQESAQESPKPQEAPKPVVKEEPTKRSPGRPKKSDRT